MLWPEPELLVGDFRRLSTGVWCQAFRPLSLNLPSNLNPEAASPARCFHHFVIILDFITFKSIDYGQPKIRSRAASLPPAEIDMDECFSQRRRISD